MADSIPTKSNDVPAPPPAVSVGSCLGQFRLVSMLGQGGMGTVYAALDTVLGRRVAIKLISPQHVADEIARKRFFREARAAASVTHPRLVTVHEVASQDSTVFLVLEYLAGGSVADVIRRSGHLDWRSATRLAIEVCQGLDACHACGIVHRDIKPANILLGDEALSFVKLSDFGLAKIRDDATTMTGSHEVLGTPAFMSPEQCRAEPVDFRSDVYSLGASYYAMLTGRPPFTGDIDIQVMFGHCSKPIPNPSELVPDVPSACHQVLLRAMAKQPRERYPTAAAMRQALEAILVDDRPPSLPTSRAGRRWVVMGAMGAGIAAACLVMVAWASWKPFTPSPRRVAAKAASVAASKDAPAGVDSDGVWTLREAPSPATGRDGFLADGEVRALAMDPRGRWLAWGSSGTGNVLTAVAWPGQWPEQTNAIVGTRRATLDTVGAAVFTPQGLLVIAADEAIFAVDLDRQESWKLLRVEKGRARSIAITPEGRGFRLVLGIEQWDDRGRVDRYTVAVDPTPRVVGAGGVGEAGGVGTRLTDTDAPVKRVAFSPDGRWLAASSKDGTLRVWSVDGWKLAATFSPAQKGGDDERYGYAVAFSPDSTRLVAGGGTSVLLFEEERWDRPTVIRKHREPVTAVAFSPDGKSLASGAGDEVLLGGYGKPDGPLERYSGHHGHLSAMAFSEDGRFLVTGGLDKRLRVIPVSTP